jgi:hypothetical protein
MPPARPSHEPIPSREREGSGAPAVRVQAVRIACGLLLACLLAAAVVPRAAASPPWQLPVTGPVARAFDYAGDPFAVGRHRGVDLAVRPGQPVRSACGGRVVFAGTAGSSGPTVSVRCGAWRVAYLPLRSLAVRGGDRVARGARIGTAAATGRHAGLHVGVRREGRRWAYVDPMQFFGDLPPPLGPVPRGLRRPRWGGPRPVPQVPTAAPRAAPAGPRLASAPRAAPAGAPAASPVPVRGRPPAPARAAAPTHPLAPWPAWAGLTLVVAGSLGAGFARRRRRATWLGEAPHTLQPRCGG